MSGRDKRHLRTKVGAALTTETSPLRCSRRVRKVEPWHLAPFTGVRQGVRPNIAHSVALENSGLEQVVASA